MVSVVVTQHPDPYKMDGVMLRSNNLIRCWMLKTMLHNMCLFAWNAIQPLRIMLPISVLCGLWKLTLLPRYFVDASNGIISTCISLMAVLAEASSHWRCLQLLSIFVLSGCSSSPCFRAAWQMSEITSKKPKLTADVINAYGSYLVRIELKDQTNVAHGNSLRAEGTP